MKAIVRKGLGAGEMYIEELPKPNISENEVLIRVKAVGICGTDAHIYSGDVVTDIPVVVGHEFSGIVEKTGANVADIKEGDRVVSRLNLGVCGVCRACLTGNPHMCEHRTCPGFKLDGAYAEYIKMDPKMLVKISENVTYEQGALVEPMAIVSHALLERTKIEAEDFVVIYGPGPIGLIALQMAKINGASKIVMVGTDVDEKQRLPLAKELGADYVFNSQKQNVEEEIRKINDGKGADLVIEASGAAPAINSGLRLLRRQGRMCALGLPGKRESSIEWLTAAEKSLNVVFTYSSSPWSWNTAVSMLNRNVFDADSLISHKMPLENYREAFQEISDGKAIKAVLLP